MPKHVSGAIFTIGVMYKIGNDLYCNGSTLTLGLQELNTDRKGSLHLHAICLCRTQGGGVGWAVH